MPLFIEPPMVTKGRGSAVGTGAGKKRARRRRKATKSHSPKPSTGQLEDEHPSFIGQELIEWHQKNRTQADGDVREPVGTAATGEQQDTVSAAYSPALPHLALGFDTRFLDTTEGKQIGNDIVQRYHELVETLSTRGLRLATLVSTVYADRKAQAGLRVGFAEGSPKGLGLSPSENMGEEGVCFPESLDASASWKLLSDVGAYLKVVLLDRPCSLTLASLPHQLTR